MTIINNSLRDSAATSHFIDAQDANTSVRGFGDLDSLSHAMIDQANIAGDDKTIYGADVRKIMDDLLDMVSKAGTIINTSPDSQVGQTGNKKLAEEIYIPTGGQQLA